MKNLLNIGNSVTLFFILLLFASISAVFILSSSRISSYFNNQDIPKIELNNFTLYQINNENLIMRLNAKNAKQFDKFEEMSDLTLEQLNNNVLDKITAPSAIKNGDTIFFDNGVKNNREDYELFTKRGIYKINKNSFEGMDNFYIISQNENITGDNIFYDRKNGVIKASNVYAKINIKNNKVKNKKVGK